MRRHIRAPPVCRVDYDRLVGQVRCRGARAASLIVAFLICGVDSAPVHGLDLLKFPDRVVRQVWQTEQGLPQVSVTSIAQTRDGYLWVGTFGGLARFDGARFTVYDAGNTPGFAGNRILSLFVDRDDVLWIGSETGLTRMDHGRFFPLTAADGLPSGHVTSIAQDGTGTVWLGTTLGVAAIRGGALIRGDWERINGDGTRAVVGGGKAGRVWAIVGSRFYEIRDGVVSERGLPAVGSGLEATAVFEASDGRVWVGYGGAWRREADGSWVELLSPDSKRLAVSSITESRDGSLMITSEGSGLTLWSNGRRQDASAFSVGADLVKFAFEDRAGGLWLGTNISGLFAWRRGRVTAWGRERGMPEVSSVPILEDRKGNLWVGATCGGLFMRAPARPAVRVRLGRRAQECVWAIAESPSGDIWVGSGDFGVYRISDGNVRAHYSRAEAAVGLVGDAVNALFFDRGGVLWIGTDRGVSRYSEGRFEIVSGPWGAGVHFFTQDRSGAIWVGARGVIRLKDGKATPFTTRDGLSDDSVRSIYEDQAGTLWIGTYGGGLNRFKDGRFFRFSTGNGLVDNTVSMIMEDDHANLWLSGNNGISRIARKDLNDLADGRRSRVDVVSFGTADGMKTREANGGGQPAGMRSKDGRLWFPTVRGVVTIDPDETRLAPLPVVIEQVLAGGQAIDLAQPSAIGPGVTELAVTYTAISFDGAVNTRFLYRLEGYDRDWIDAGSRRQAFYTHLPPGAYRFQVKARNSDGIWNETGASIPLEILPHFYQTTWFAVLVALFLGLGTWRASAAGVRLRTQTIQRRNQVLQAEIAERLRVERELEANNQQLEARNAEMERFVYTASHDLKTPLVTIKGYVGLLERTVAQVVPDPMERKRVGDDLGRVDKAADTMRRLLDDLLHLSKTGRPIHEPTAVGLSEVALEAAALVSGRDEARVQALSIDASMPKVRGDRTRLIEVYQNLIENAFKFVDDPKAPRVEVGARQDKDEVLCWVRDNGIGIDARYGQKIFGLFERLDQRIPGTGVGLAVVKRVVEAHRGKIWVESEGAGRGSTFYFTLPLAD